MLTVSAPPPCRDEPLAGRGEDEFVVSEGKLLVITTNWVGGQELKYTQVYNRR